MSLLDNWCCRTEAAARRAGGKGEDERIFHHNSGRVYPVGLCAGTGELGPNAVKCRVCGWGMHKHELRKVLNTSRKSDYNGEPDYGSCGDRACNAELQARVDCESAIDQHKDVKHLLELSGQRLAANYANAQPHYTVAQLYKWMDKSVENFSEQLSLVSYDREWYNSDPHQWQ